MNSKTFQLKDIEKLSSWKNEKESSEIICLKK